MLGVAAMAASRSKNTYLAARDRRLASRPGPPRAIVHTILTAIWHMLSTGEVCDDPGADYYTRLDSQKARNKAIRQLRSLGYDVAVTPTAA